MIKLDYEAPKIQSTNIIINQANKDSIRFLFTLYQGANLMTTTGFSRAEMVFKKADNSNVVVDSDTLTNTAPQVTYLLTNEIFAAAGWVLGYINLYKGSEIHATLYYKFLVVEDLLNLEHISKCYISPIEIVIQQIQVLIGEIQNMRDTIEGYVNDAYNLIDGIVQDAQLQVQNAVNQVVNQANISLGILNDLIQQAQLILDGLETAAFATVSYVNNAVSTAIANLKDGSLQTGLNADMLDGQHGSYYASASSVANMAVKDGTVQTNLNADMLDGNHASYFASAANLASTNSTVSGLSGTVSSLSSDVAALDLDKADRVEVLLGTRQSQTYNIAASALQTTINNLPKLIKDLIVINISGTTANAISFSNFVVEGNGQLQLRGDASGTHSVGRITVSNCTCSGGVFLINNIRLTATAVTSIDFVDCVGYFEVLSNWMVTGTATNTSTQGIRLNSSAAVVWASGNEISNKYNAFSCVGGGMLATTNTTGTGNTALYNADFGGRVSIGQNNTIGITSTGQRDRVQRGGFIFVETGGIDVLDRRVQGSIDHYSQYFRMYSYDRAAGGPSHGMGFIRMYASPANDRLQIDLMKGALGSEVTAGTDFNIMVGNTTNKVWHGANYPYVIGTWTPAFVGATTAGSYTYTRQSGVYTRLGNMCIVTGSIVLSGITTAGSGQLRIGSLPIAHTASSYSAATIGYSANFATPPLEAYIDSGWNYIGLINNGTSFAATNLTATSRINFSAVYRVATS